MLALPTKCAIVRARKTEKLSTVGVRCAVRYGKALKRSIPAKFARVQNHLPSAPGWRSDKAGGMGLGKETEKQANISEYGRNRLDREFVPY